MFYAYALFAAIALFVIWRLYTWRPVQPEPPCAPSRKSIITDRSEYQPRRFRWHGLERSIQKKEESHRKLDDYPF